MAISDFKDSIIRDREKGFTVQQIANRFNCSRQHISCLLKKWNASKPLVPTNLEQKQERALQAVRLLVDGGETSIKQAARRFRIDDSLIRNTAERNGVDLAAALEPHRAKERANRLNGQWFNGLKVVDGTYHRGTDGVYYVEAICAVCGTRKVFRVANLRGGYTKTCGQKCGARFRKGDYTKTL